MRERPLARLALVPALLLPLLLPVVSGCDDKAATKPPADAAPPANLVEIQDPAKFPKAVYQPQPQTPNIVTNSGTQGDVVVRIVVGENGKVHDAKMVKSNPMFDGSVLFAVKSWKFEPLVVNGKAAAWATNLEMHFGDEGMEFGPGKDKDKD